MVRRKASEGIEGTVVVTSKVNASKPIVTVLNHPWREFCEAGESNQVSKNTYRAVDDAFERLSMICFRRQVIYGQEYNDQKLGK